MALLDEVTLVDAPIDGERFRRLYAFVHTLHEHFPTKTFDAGWQQNGINVNARVVVKRAIGANLRLERSERARLVFAHMKRLLEAKPAAIAAAEWRQQFENVEVPKNANVDDVRNFPIFFCTISACLRLSICTECELATLCRHQCRIPRLHLWSVDNIPCAHRSCLHRLNAMLVMAQTQKKN